jgi:hypothetical protein
MMTTIDELYAQINALPSDQRATLIARLLHDATPDHASDQPQWKTGAEIVALIESMPPIQLIDDHIDDPVAWVNAQRAKRQALVEARVAEYDAQHELNTDNHIPT